VHRRINKAWECYNSKLGLDYNLDKDLSKSRVHNQLIKCKNIKIYNYISKTMRNS